MKGIVVALKGNTYSVRTGDGTYRCIFRGKAKRERLKAGKPAAVGDEVEVTPGQAGEGSIESVAPRRTKLSRHDVHDPNKEQVIVANVDVLIAVQAVARPALDLFTLDRALVMGESAGMDCAACFNKTDLAGGEPEEAAALYHRMGYPVFCTSAQTGLGVDGLREFIRGKTVVMLGPSGVGKSSLLHAMYPEITIKVGEVSAGSGKGKHTTTWVELFEIAPKTFLADTPGIEFFTLWRIRPDTLAGFFRDIAPYASGCRFKNCSHTKETGCAVKKSVDEGNIAPDRYRRYLQLFNELWDINAKRLLKYPKRSPKS